METTTPSPAPSGATAPPAVAEDRTVAILSYITWIGFIVAIVIHMNKKTRLGAFHLRQMLGLILTSICSAILVMIPFLGWIAFGVLWIALLVFWIMGLVSAAKGEMKPVPWFGALYQRWFGTAFD